MLRSSGLRILLMTCAVLLLTFGATAIIVNTPLPERGVAIR
ncbi:hypothetical protein [Massilia sp.]|nr:hypothetical protein [Massilia sp.]